MKANELMIGDIVRVNKDVSVKKGTIVKVREIDGDRRFQELMGCISCVAIDDIDEMTAGVWLAYIDPIPLTADILVANGWERNPLLKYNDELRILDDYYELNIHEFNDGTWNVQYDCIEMGGIPMCSMNICYVHELQHFLRAVGIDTEIIVKEATP